ncbi:uncharacterized protein LOC134260692 [Saccostrea cucullata]|uniref:uncharacterized protein LOC134260692 n=1 Tax=Saccostrea cuccullata TaxID=36930 RepID=UPI002ED4770F
MSGLHINYAKTHIVWIGSKKYSNEILLPNYNLNWGTTRFTLLGIHFDVELDKLLYLNYDPKLVQIKSILRQWEKRYLTPIGKITVIKTLVLPLLNHILMSIPNPTESYCKELDKIFFSFLWNNSIHRVKKEVIIKNYEDGGLKMLNLKSFISSMKLFWIRQLIFTNRGMEHLIPNFNLDKFINCGIDYVTIYLKTLKNKFWIDVFKSWIILQNHEIVSEVAGDSPLFYNPMIRIGGKPFYNKQMFNNNIRRVNDIINEDGSFLSFESFCNTYPMIKMNFLEYSSIIHAIKSWIKNSGLDIPIKKLENPLIMRIIYKVMKCHKSKCFYEILNHNSSMSTGKTKWSEMLQIDNKEWKKFHKIPFRVTKDCKLQWFQYRIINRILATNSFLFKINKNDSKYCNFCLSEEETIEHLLWECDYTQSFLEEFVIFLEDKTGLVINITKKSFILGYIENNTDIQNTIALWLKYYVYTSRCTKKSLNLCAAISQMKFYYEIHKFISYRNSGKEKFDAQWIRWNQLFY